MWYCSVVGSVFLRSDADQNGGHQEELAAPFAVFPHQSNNLRTQRKVGQPTSPRDESPFTVAPRGPDLTLGRPTTRHPDTLALDYLTVSSAVRGTSRAVRTDALQYRFGRYRQLAGSQYHISVVQFHKSEIKLRFQSFLPLVLNFSEHGRLLVSPIEKKLTSTILLLRTILQTFFEISVKENDLASLKGSLPCLAYVAEYCAHSILQKLSCPHCRDSLVIDRDLEVEDNLVLIKSLDTGGLKYPSNIKLIVVFYGAAVAEQLSRSPPTKANRVQSPAGSPDLRMWKSCRTMPLVVGLSRGSPVCPAPSFRHCSILTSITLIGSQDLAVKSRPNLFTFPQMLHR
ncbi:hypothetical protein PR048_005019 [Dryococelus australis]|uniref:Uncharacterized protein n=1 Tax=Dryococelus australis TaxID=614101 RepID=A0ABQ9I724_9NEOP|nr:hypothetical protein PR048_005019 [Dryococelus australis]